MRGAWPQGNGWVVRAGVYNRSTCIVYFDANRRPWVWHTVGLDFVGRETEMGQTGEMEKSFTKGVGWGGTLDLLDDDGDLVAGNTALRPQHQGVPQTLHVPVRWAPDGGHGAPLELQLPSFDRIPGGDLRFEILDPTRDQGVSPGGPPTIRQDMCEGEGLVYL